MSRVAVLCLTIAMLLLVDVGECTRGLLRLQRRAASENMVEVVHSRRRMQSPTYCVANPGADQTKLQDALDWACGTGTGNGNVDCSGILQTGSCYQPNTLQAHASYAFNYYYVKQNGASGSCDFGGLATVTGTNPSSGSCVYSSVGGTTSTTTTTTPTTTTGSTNGTNIFTPTSSTNSTAFGTTTGSSSAATITAYNVSFGFIVLAISVVLSSFLH